LKTATSLLLANTYKDIPAWPIHPTRAEKMKPFACWFTHGIGKNGKRSSEEKVHEAWTSVEGIDAGSTVF